jgi:phenylalanyl-tRNA synthetase alpha chain
MTVRVLHGLFEEHDMNAAAIGVLQSEAVNCIDAAKNADDLEAARIKYLGRNGLLPQIMKSLRELQLEDRAAAGRSANEFKDSVSRRLEDRKAAFSAGAEERRPFDLTTPGCWRTLGTSHPISSVIQEVVRVFSRLGFTVAEGPDIETRYHNFEALNTADYHPSMDPTDTFWLESGELLRTQTSPVQIRVMESRRPPVRIITPGRCYRRDTTDATHSANFHQLEGLYVDTNVSLADLKGLLAFFAREMMGPGVGVRFRPHFFPFTEPSVECDFSCHVCGGKGCRVCKQSGWIEIAGAGMVDPRVFQKVGYDPETTTGYAFGMGIERIAMIKYGIGDIRMLYENDLRFLSQFA